MVATKPSGAPKYRSLTKDLSVFGAADLYEYSCPKGVANPRKASSESLVGSADIRINDYGKITSERSAAERLRSRAREIFGDESERERYDAYLQWAALKAVFDALAQAPRADGKVADQAVADARTELTNLLDGDVAKAQALLEDYDKNYDGKIGLVQRESPVETEVSSVSDKPIAQPQLEKTCPSCGSRVKQNSRFCSYCRYDFVHHSVVSTPPVQIPIQDRTSPPIVRPDDSQRNQAKWPTVVIIVAIVVIIISIWTIVTTLSGTAHALQAVQAGVGAIPMVRSASRDSSKLSCF